MMQQVNMEIVQALLLDLYDRQYQPLVGSQQCLYMMQDSLEVVVQLDALDCFCAFSQKSLRYLKTL
jgi:hypothetical protein